MKQKGDMSLLKLWLIIAASLIDDAIVLALVLLLLWLFQVEFTWYLFLILAALMAAFVFIMHKAVVPAIRRRKLTGAEGMVGMLGIVAAPLKPKGTVKIKGEYWNASSVAGNIEAGESVEVVDIEGLHLKVRKKSRER
jgi:membrane-bound serine protease (ClpP class)